MTTTSNPEASGAAAPHVVVTRTISISLVDPRRGTSALLLAGPTLGALRRALFDLAGLAPDSATCDIASRGTLVVTWDDGE